jgi:hypothetical protein
MTDGGTRTAEEHSQPPDRQPHRAGNARTRDAATASHLRTQPREQENRTAMPTMNLDVVDAAELAELLQFLTGWTATDSARLAPSLLAYVGHPAYGLPQLRNDLNRFTFLLGGNDGEPLFQPGPLSATRPPAARPFSLQPVTRNQAGGQRRIRAFTGQRLI